MPTVKPLAVGAVGYDTSQQLTPAQVKTLAGLGLRYGVRYVPLASQAPSVGLQPAEYEAMLGDGLGVMLVQFSRGSGWSADTGQADGQAAGAYARQLGFPPDACLWLDLSPCGGSVEVCTAYANAWYKGAVAAGQYGSSLGVYCEPGVPLSSQQLYHDLSVARYWRTAGACPNVATRGYQFLQLYPGNRVVSPGIVIDYDVAQSDYLKSYPVAAFQ